MQEMRGFVVVSQLIFLLLSSIIMVDFIMTEATYSLFYLSFRPQNPTPNPSSLSFPLSCPTLVRVCNLRSCVNNQMRNFSRENVRTYHKQGVARTLTGQKAISSTATGLKQTQVRVGKYKYDSSDQLGKGFSSHVYKGVQILRPHMRYAIKVINLKKFRGSNMEMLQTEISTHRHLQHQNIVRLYQVVKTSHHYYLILEYCPHGSLSEYIAQKKQLSQANTLQISTQIFSAYRYLMAEGVIHRDIKPANIMRVGNKWKLSDFGFAVKSRFGFKDRMNVGTPLYMAPESLKKNYYSSKSDLYSLGIVVFEMLVGRTPHQVENQRELMDRMASEIPIPKFIKNVKLIEFITKSCQMSEQKRMSKEEFQAFDLGALQQSTVSHSPSLNNCSSMLSLKGRKTSGGGTTTDDSVSKKDSSTQPRTGSNSLSKQASKQTSHENSIYGNQKPSQDQLKPHKNPMIANKQQLCHQLSYVQHFYFTIQNIQSFHLQQNTRSMFMLTLFKLLLKMMRLLCDKEQNHFRLPNWQEYQQCKLHQEFYSLITVLSEQYQKEYLEFIKHNDIKVIRAVNRKFPQLCHNAPLTPKFYENFKAFMAGVVREHNQQVSGLASDDPLSDRYEASLSAYSIFKLAQARSNNPLASHLPEKPIILPDYTLSKRSKSDFLSVKRSLPSL